MTTRTKITLGAATAVLVTAATALAAPNREASLTPGGPGYGWDGGPISGGALFAEVGAVVPCGPGKECDDTLIRAPQRGQLVVEIDSPDAHPGQDIDLYVFESDEEGTPGRQLKSSTTATSKESVTVNVPGGIYLARVVAAAAADATFDGTATQAVLPPLDEDRRPPDFGPDPAPPPAGSGGGAGGGAGGGGAGGGISGSSRTTPPIGNAAPSSRVRRPGRRSRTLAGVASDPDGTVLYVDVALVRLRSDGRCRALSPRGTFRRIRKCTAPPFVRARGTGRWKVRMKRPLAPGRYALYSRATDNAGRPEGGFGAGNLLKFRVR
ncbi:MAG TPA: hypothetical protein VGW75_00415 [Solirubrobacteraceae bacterium]|jgi:hypothetical protein|nr:hypothetical protein [Solirubrobacteraceae bacterium]